MANKKYRRPGSEPKKPIYDLHGLEEDDRIRLMGSLASSGKSTGFILEDDEEKIARYTDKFARWFPDVAILRLGNLTTGPAATVAFKAERRQN